MARDNRHYDVLIVGGSLAGTAFACALQHYLAPKSAWRIAVADIKEPMKAVPTKVAPDPATTALSAGSINILRDMGVWDLILPHAAPMSSVMVRAQHMLDSGAGSAKPSVLLHTRESQTETIEVGGVAALGAVVETTRLLAAMHTCLQGNKNIQWLAPASVEKPQALSGGGYSVQIGGQDYSTDLLGIADGPRSTLRGELGIATENKSYGTDCLLLNAQLSGDEPHRAYELFLADGSLALLPIPSQPSNKNAKDSEGERGVLLVRTIHSTESGELPQAGEVLEEAAQLLSLPAGALRSPGTLRSRPLSMIWSKEQHRRGMVLLGDAAHALHPIAAQGFNLSLRDVNELARLLVNSKANGTALWDLATLSRYASARHYDQWAARMVSDGLPRLFSHHNPLKDAALRLGFATLKNITPLRRAFVRRAAGV